MNNQSKEKTILLLATNNQGKIRELKTLLKDLPYKIITIKDLKKFKGGIQIKETGKTFEENAIIKAEALGMKTGIITLADDSGLEVEALNNRPGVYSRRYGRSSQQRNSKLLKEMENISENKRSARFIAAVALYFPFENKTQVFMGKTEGKITYKVLGNQGFGYDPIFFSNELNKTFGQATLREKNKVSHRTRALVKAKESLSKLIKSSL